MKTSTERGSHWTELRNLRIDRAAVPPQQNRTKRLIVIGAAVVVVCVIAAIALRAVIRPTPVVETAHAMPVTSASSGTALSATGYIVAHHKIDVNSKVTGRVKWIGVEKGDHVKAGQVLVELEDDEFKAQTDEARGQVEAARAYLHELRSGFLPQEIEQARNDLEEVRATTRNDKLSLDRTRYLAQAGVVARQQLDDAEARYDADQQKSASLSQSYALKKVGPRTEEIQRAVGSLIAVEGQLEYAQAQVAATKIRAPVSGTILERTAEKGELVTSTFASAAAGGPLGSVVSLADLKDLQVELDIAQDEFARLHPRQHAVVTTDAFPDRKYNGTLAEISPEANRQKATVQVKVQIDNTDDYLRPDMNAAVQFISDASPMTEARGGILIPANALHSSKGGQYVLVALNDRAVAREVHVIRRRSGLVVVDGLNGGEDVITDAQPAVKEGDRIRRKQEK
jgi:HlyD family secretion protein